MRMRDATAIWTKSIAISSQEPLGGIAVSRHFSYLADQVRSSGRGDADDLQAIERFLWEQSDVETRLAGEAKSRFAVEPSGIEAAFDLGFRAVRFFDAISLWLCCAERDKPERMTAPTGEAITLIPKSASHIAIDPYPLGVDSLRLETPARRVAARKYESDAEFQEAFNAAPLERLTWTISR